MPRGSIGAALIAGLLAVASSSVYGQGQGAQSPATAPPQGAITGVVFDAVTGNPVASATVTLSKTGVVHLVAMDARETTLQRDIPYGDDPLQRLDIVTPQVRDFPTVVFVHGGSLTSGDKADADYGKVCDAFPAAGIGCANVNYRLLPAVSWPVPVEDVATAVAWVHDHSADRGGDPNRIFLLGHSSGAMLVARVGADASLLSQHRLTTDFIRGVMPMGSIMWDDDLRQSVEKNGREQVAAGFARDPRGKAYGSLDQYESMWPIRYVRKGMPPFLFLIAEREQINPPILKTNQQFVEDARALGNQADLKVLAGRTHYANIRQIHEPADEVFATVVAFIRKH